MNKLPKMYHNKIDKKISNNEIVFSTINKNIVVDKKIDRKDTILNIYEKINNIFKSPNYIYKIDVIIVMDDGKYIKRLVGKNKDNLITMDKELIPINKIKDIYIKND